jgi:hypothetical protein
MAIAMAPVVFAQGFRELVSARVTVLDVTLATGTGLRTDPESTV